LAFAGMSIDLGVEDALDVDIDIGLKPDLQLGEFGLSDWASV